LETYTRRRITPAYTVPSEPFVAILKKRHLELVAAGVPDPKETLVREAGIAERIMRRVLDGEQDTLSFDNADRIVTRLLGPMEWHTDPVLSEIYEAVDLAAMDRRYPCVVAA
jgi:hypothetical protein